jgi:hypothetical protein
VTPSLPKFRDAADAHDDYSDDEWASSHIM